MRDLPVKSGDDVPSSLWLSLGWSSNSSWQQLCQKGLDSALFLKNMEGIDLTLTLWQSYSLSGAGEWGAI